MSRYGAALNHELTLDPRTTLADAARAIRAERAYRSQLGKPLSLVERFGPVSADVAALIREQAADQAKDAALSVERTGEFRRELEAVLPLMAERRVIAHTVARRLERCEKLATESNARDLRKLPQQMFLCRVEGDACEAGEGGQRFTFLNKCNSTRFCPDCAREHSRYEAMRYSTALLEYVNRGGNYRAFQAVFTRPSAPLGSMSEAIAETFAMFRAWFDTTRTCSDVQRRRHGWSKRKKKIPLWRPGQQTRADVKNGETRQVYDGPGIHGALVQLECHLTAKGAWHPHLNVILLVKGDFSYKLARRAWRYNVQFQHIAPGARGFAAAFAELIKYPFRHVAEKTAAKAEAGETQAPAFEHWPDAAVVEWHAATRAEVECSDGDTRIQGARWLRSYGCLHGIPPPPVERQQLAPIAHLTFTDDGAYSVGPFVGSIPGSKFPRSHEKTKFPDYRVPDIRPPPPRSKPPGEP